MKIYYNTYVMIDLVLSWANLIYIYLLVPLYKI